MPTPTFISCAVMLDDFIIHVAVSGNPVFCCPLVLHVFHFRRVHFKPYVSTQCSYAFGKFFNFYETAIVNTTGDRKVAVQLIELNTTSTAFCILMNIFIYSCTYIRKNLKTYMNYNYVWRNL